MNKDLVFGPKLPTHFLGEPISKFSPFTPCGKRVDGSDVGLRASSGYPDCPKCLAYVKKYRPELVDFNEKLTDAIWNKRLEDRLWRQLTPVEQVPPSEKKV